MKSEHKTSPQLVLTLTEDEAKELLSDINQYTEDTGDGELWHLYGTLRHFLGKD